jgi:septum formation protein
MKLYLASQSPRRQELLRQIGVEFELLLPGADEDAESLEVRHGQESPRRYVVRVCRLKAIAALERQRLRHLPLLPVLCADTTVALGNTIYGKPESDAHAMEMLGELAGTTHRVLTAVCIASPPGASQDEAGPQFLEALSISRVSFTALTREQLHQYVATGEPRGKAGAYAIQGHAAAFIEHIAGSHSGIMGLPLHETAKLLASITIAA